MIANQLIKLVALSNSKEKLFAIVAQEKWETQRRKKYSPHLTASQPTAL